MPRNTGLLNLRTRPRLRRRRSDILNVREPDRCCAESGIFLRIFEFCTPLRIGAGLLTPLLFDKGLSQADVLQSLAADATINDLVRHRATELARRWK